MTEKINAPAFDSWECICGNRPWLDGFWPFDLKREEAVEPSLGDAWDEVHSLCASCGRVVHGETLEVVTRLSPEALKAVIDRFESRTR